VRPIHLIPLMGGVSPGPRIEPSLDRLEFLGASLARIFRRPCQIRPQTLDIVNTWDAARQQYYSTAILQCLERSCDGGARVLGVTACDLFVPVLTFVFGEAQLDGHCAAVSMARLDEKFYGLPAREELLRDRLLKEAVHELGHTFGLRHCADWRCVMSSSHGVERLDVKGADFCGRCRKPVFNEHFW
jgi:archaemetzincin